MPLDRRDFLAASAAAGWAAMGAAPVWAAAEKNDLRIAVVGLRGRGKSHLAGLGKRVVALCDADRDVLDEQHQKHLEERGVDAQKYVDFREMLDKADIDGVAIATPNHTHCWIGVEAMQAGKHVYVEKPISHNTWEGRQLVAAARKHDRIVQCGTQSRSSPSLQQAVKWLHSGELGSIQYATGTCYKPRPPIGELDKPLSISKAVDYDLWCGPAAKEDLYRPQLHYDWHWDWNTGNGDMGNQGIHQMDIARWFLGEDRLAPRSRSVGGRLGYDDAGNTPNTQVVYHDYEAAPLLFETRGLPRSKEGQKQWGRSMDRYRGSGIGVIVQCEGGHLVIPSYSSVTAFDRSGKVVKEWSGGGDHFANWVEAIQQNDRSILNGEVQEGHLSSSLCHTGGVSHLVGEKATAEVIADELAADPLFSDAFERMAGHLRANQVDIDSSAQLTLGPWLEVDPQTEQFVDNTAAQAHFKRDARQGYAVADLGA
ncbi:Gfo/Idh/MocA family oxidoreductase [Botrimarina sp.]|uniref:Gfo/Idh/MocA family protein n=1 Tax=Botrimarina sp. TaxID=2795802 RepID=UPI0032F02BB2